MTELARDAVRIPAVGLLVNAVFIAAANVLFLVGTSVGMTLGGLGVFGETGMAEKMTSGAINMASAVTGILVCGYIAWSAYQMLKLRHHTHALAGAVLSMIPCFTLVCCVTSLPFAVWALIVLRRPEVQTAFQ